MNSLKLAFPDWVMGQVLLPEQFKEQQEAILGHIRASAELSGLPADGLVRLAIDQDRLAAGTLRIERLTYLFPSGRLIDVPGNAVAVDLPVKEGPSDVVAIHLHVSKVVMDAANLTLYVDDPRTIRRVIYQVVLSLQPRLDNAFESVELMRVKRSDKRWSMVGYAPPLLRVGAAVSPFLRVVFDRIVSAVQSVADQLGQRIKDPFIGVGQGAELRRVRAAAQRVLMVLGDHGFGLAETQHQVALHPYFLYSGLREFCMEAGALRDKPSDFSQLRYKHDDLAGSFEELERRVRYCVGSYPLSTRRLQFELRTAWYVAGPFPEDLKAAGQVILILKPGPNAPLKFAAVKLASRRRIEEVYTRALAGVPLNPLKSSAIAHAHGDDAVAFEIGTQDQEWELALRDGDLCFPAWRELDGVRAMLVWEM